MNDYELTPNSQLRAEARKALSEKWGVMIVATVIYAAIAIAVCMIFQKYYFICACASVLLFSPLLYGINLLSLKIYRRNATGVETMFEGFSTYTRVVLTMLLRGIYTSLWGLLLIIPGIVKGYSYALTPYVMIDKPELGYNECIEESMRLMDGYKMKLFLLDLSFIGYALLSVITFGIGYIFLLPYIEVAHAAFYEDVKALQS